MPTLPHPSTRQARPSGRGPGRRAGRRRRTILIGSAVAVALVLGYALFQYVSLTTGITRSDILGSGSPNGANILVMGLDSRVDENGDPLPKDIYDALHAGDQTNGGLNANVLMLVHLPVDGSKATEISIPRDDYVDLAGCPDGQCKGKIKQAYGLAFAAAATSLVKDNSLTQTQRQQKQRDAGRTAEIATVKAFLGAVPIDHFVEVTMVAFYQLAQVVQPITVCVAQDTQDPYSGADFHAGTQQINAAQALAFVRQRRDEQHPHLNFTDLDRERRQQAFIASLTTQLKKAGTLANPATLSGILAVARQNIAVDGGLDLLSLAEQASHMAGGNVTYYTLPVDHFGKDPLGEDVNVVNVPRIQATVAALLGTTAASATATPSDPVPPAKPTAAPASQVKTVDIVNSSGRPGLGSQLGRALRRMGYPPGATTTGAGHAAVTTILYPPGGLSSADQLTAALPGTAAAPSATLSPGTLRIVLGADFALPAAPGGVATAASPSGDTGGGVAATAVPITAAGAAPPPDAMSALSGEGVPCVK
ncbi:LCP family protein [Lapillicoccus sp.]|uniref:LCP family protein n=1 Tax=Lapillicoccus sp. TaxID=1909287 RepID=UPI003267F094